MKFHFLILLLIASSFFATVAHAAGAVRLTAADSHASMAAFKMAFQENVDHESCADLLTADWFIADRSFGTAMIAAETMNYNLKVIRGGEELLRIFKLASSNQKDFRMQLDVWLLKHGRMKAITLAELKTVLSKDSSLDFPIFDSPQDEAKGFISHKAYTYAVAQGFFPMGDPHDLFFHIPAFLDPRFGDALRRIAKLIFETAGRAEYEKLFTYLTGVLREIGVENWSYSVGDPVTPSLFLQGNIPFFAITDLQREKLVSSFVHIQNANNSVYDFRAFPNWQNFARQHPIASILKELEPMLKSVEIPRDYAVNADKRLSEELGDSFETADVLQKLAAFINRDPLLKTSYSRETRGQAALLLLDLTESYWHWIQLAPLSNAL